MPCDVATSFCQMKLWQTNFFPDEIVTEGRKQVPCTADDPSVAPSGSFSCDPEIAICLEKWQARLGLDLNLAGFFNSDWRKDPFEVIRQCKSCTNFAGNRRAGSWSVNKARQIQTWTIVPGTQLRDNLVWQHYIRHDHCFPMHHHGRMDPNSLLGKSLCSHIYC